MTDLRREAMEVTALAIVVLLIALFVAQAVADEGPTTEPVYGVHVTAAPRLPAGCVATDLSPAGMLCVRVAGPDAVGGEPIGVGP